MIHFENKTDVPDGHGPLPKRNVFKAMRRGLSMKCPHCGTGSLYEKYLKVVPECGHCHEALHHQRADDAPAYFTISIVGKLVVGMSVGVELAYAPPYWLHAVIWIPLLIIMALGLLPVIKGALVGLQWANYMHGFNPHFVEGDDVELPSEDTLSRRGTS